jgi:nucleotide-binding universal stress UspA family protein
VNFDRIAVGIDFSPASRDALARAVTLVADGGAIELVHSVESAFVRWSSELDDRAVAEMHAKLRGAAQKELDAWAEAPRASGLQVSAVVKEGRPADEVLAAAAGADLLVLGTHQRGILGHLVLGSIAEEVASRSPIPTLVVRPQAEPGARPVARVVVAVDPASPSREALAGAADLARRLGARLEAIHILRLPTASYASSALGGVGPGAVATHLAAAEASLRKLVRDTTGVDATVHVAAGRPADEILKHVGANDILACATHGRSGLGRLVFGSVAAKLVRHAPCPVLVVRFS